MMPFAKTRAAAEYAARHGRSELTRTRGAVLLEQLAACQAALGDDNGRQAPAAAGGLLRELVLAVRDLAGRTWLNANSDDSDVAAFTVMQAMPAPPGPEEIDETCARVLWARFGFGRVTCAQGAASAAPGGVDEDATATAL